MEHKTVEELVSIYLAARSQGAAAELLVRFGSMVHSVIRNLLPSPRDVDDIYQEVWLKVFRSLPALREHSRFGGWVKHIAITTTLDHLRKDSNITELPEFVCKPDHSPGALIQMEVRQAVSTLPEHYRQAVALYYYLDLSCEDIAHILGLPHGTVLSRLRKARELLSRKLHNYREGG